MDGRKRKLERVKREIALEILGYLGDFLQNMGSNDVLVNFTTIHELWQSRNKTGSFKSCGVKMHFKKFLLTVCNLREDPSNKEICLCNEHEVREKIHEFSCAVGNDDDNNNKENENCAVSENTVESEAAETPGNAESTALGPNEGLHSSTVCRLTPQPLLENSQSMEEIDAKPQARYANFLRICLGSCHCKCWVQGGRVARSVSNFFASHYRVTEYFANS